MKKALKITAIGLLLLFLFRSVLYRYTINYTPIKEIKAIPLIDKKVIAAIEVEIGNEQLDLQKITNISTKITNQYLKFTFQRASNNPNKIVLTGKANCVGYAALYSAVANYLINKAESQNRFQSKHLVGKLDFLGIDLNALFTSPFYKNHDYNLIEDKKTGVVLLIDPSLDDYLYLGAKFLN